MIEPVPAQGATRDELQKRIADKYREANLIPQATVTVAEAAMPATQKAAITTQPLAMPASQPVFAAATTQPASQDVAVVVLIEKSASITPPK
jgi:protein involved in polysaccharide export with SLBB domain